MALPSSGAISLGAVNTELGVSATAARSLNDSTTRTLFGVPSGPISLSNGYGKANEIKVVFQSNQLNASVNINTLPMYSAGSSNIRIVVNNDIYLWSDSSTPALTLTGGSLGDSIIIENNGFIMGRGGDGTVGQVGSSYPLLSNKTPGYDAISISYPTTVDNRNGYIGGGGGAGGDGAYIYSAEVGAWPQGGGGAGGGNSAALSLELRAIGGAVGQLGGLPPDNPDVFVPTVGNAGGRVMPGSTTSLPNPASAGGPGGSFFEEYDWSISVGGGGGGYGASGGLGIGGYSTQAPAPTPSVTGGDGGGGGNTGGNASSSIPTTAVNYPSAGGKAIRTNGHAVTWIGGAASSGRSFGAVN